MKILVIPDIHEDLNFLRYIIAMEDPSKYDKVVMLGDYFDPPEVANPDDNILRQVAGTILGFKEILGDKLHLLCGNHDLPYYALRPTCGAPAYLLRQADAEGAFLLYRYEAGGLWGRG